MLMFTFSSTDTEFGYFAYANGTSTGQPLSGEIRTKTGLEVNREQCIEFFYYRVPGETLGQLTVNVQLKSMLALIIPVWTEPSPNATVGSTF